MYLRESRRTNRDGSVVAYLQLAHNERHPETGNPVAKVIHSFGRAEQVDRAALARLVSSILRFLTPEEAAAAAHGADVEIVDSRPMGGAWTLDQVWQRLGIGAAIRKAASGRRPGLRHIDGLSGFGGRRSSRRMVLGLRAAARRAAAMLRLPASRSAVVTRLRMQARTAGALPVRARWASSR